MVRVRCLFGAVAMCVLLCGQALAQPALSPQLIQQNTPLTQAQVELVTQHARWWVRQLLNEKSGAQDVARARAQLEDPLNSQPGQAFAVTYSSTVGTLLQRQNATDPKKPVAVRLNAMIVVSKLVESSAVPLIAAGLRDESAAVRYWAGIAVRNVAARPTVSAADHAAMLAALAPVLASEQSPRVFNQYLQGLVKLDVPEAATALLDGLDGRIDIHAQDGGMPLFAEYEALAALFQNVVQTRSAGQTVPDGMLRNLSKVAMRYYLLAAVMLDTQRAGPGVANDYRRMLELSNKILPWTVGNLAPNVTTPAPLTSEIAMDRWAMILLRGEEWRRFLQGPPLSFKPEQLNVEIPK